MPSALLELGFISNPEDYKYLSTADGQEKVAANLFEAFKAYKTQYDASVSVDEAPVSAQTQSVTKQTQAGRDGMEFRSWDWVESWMRAIRDSRG